MPGKNIIKIYDENGYYHVYNRGVEKREVFLDHQDYVVFISYLRDYLCPPDDLVKIYQSRKIKNYSGVVDLLAYCLMPNHFHFLLKQHTRRSMTDFMKSLLTRYSMYFNRKYERVGTLFQGNYRAVTISSDEQLIYTSRYLHRNPLSLDAASGLDPEAFLKLRDYSYSSLQNYLGYIDQDWIKKDEAMNIFVEEDKVSAYKEFIVGENTSGLDPEVMEG